jgi:basic membrane lipoprotein Med (substrate-binding protein (PBP1-ABC) superfamily)
MSYNKLWRFVVVLVILAVFVTACGEAPAVEEPTTEEEAAPAEEEEVAPAEEEEVEEPTDLKIAVLTASPLESAFNFTLMNSLEAIKEERPHDLTVSWDVTEQVTGPDAVRVMRDYADTGEYGIIWCNSSFSDEVAEVRSDYPDIAFVVTGAPNEAPGGNQYRLYMLLYEPAYLLGMYAGLLTEANKLGVVAAFPYEDVNSTVNAFFDGAKAVNPDVEMDVVYIESWFDPAAASEAAYSLISAGVDQIYAERPGVTEAAAESGVLVYGHQMDTHHMGPDVVVSSDVAKWEPGIRFVIDEWWNHVTAGVPYDAPTGEGEFWFNFEQGGADIAPLYEFEDKLPPEIIETVEQARKDMLAGDLVVEFRPEEP